MVKKVLGIVLFVASILSLMIGFSIVASSEDAVFLAYQSSIAKIVAFDNYQVIVNS